MTTTQASGFRRVLLYTACPLAIIAGTLPAIAQTGDATTKTPAPVRHHSHKTRHVSATTAAKVEAPPILVAANEPVPAGRGSAGSGAAAPAFADAGESVIVTGTRSLNRKARDSTSPIDVISATTLRRSGEPNLASALVKTDPSINIKAEGSDTAALTANIVLRGLNPNDTLILLDGKRRHPTSNIAADSGPEQGSTAPDINMIPSSAIDHIEVLRDGAAAQYGSDAIAGVVNIITKKSDHGFNASAQTGANAANGDGWLYQLDADGGTSFGRDGYLHIGGGMYHKDFFVAPTEDNRAAKFGSPLNSNKILGVPEETRETLSIAAGETLVPDLFGGVQGYGLITYAHRHSEGYENWRTPTVLPQLYPNGFSPLETNDENDFATTLGLKAEDFFGFHVDISSTYGDDETDIGNKNTANPNLYKTGAEPGDPDFDLGTGFTPTKVLAQTQRTAQWTNNLDFTQPFTVFGKSVNLAFGAEHRLDTYQLGAGNPASWEVGGTQGFAGLRPQNAGSWNRDVYAGYIDLDTHPLKHWDLDFAGRFEHYTDSGNTENGKVSTRYDFSRRFAIRGTISNGFRAPSLAEEHFSSLNVGPTSASGDLAVDSAAGRSIGALPLKPERSTNVSAGFVVEPITNLSITTDVYQINIRDRIVGAGGVTGQPALDAIELTGATIPANAQVDQISAFYFANGVSTRTQGLNVAANYFSDFRQYGTVNWTAGIDLNRTRLHHVGTDGLGNPFLTAQGAGYVTTATPRSKIILNAFWKIGKVDVNVRETRWGQTTNLLGYQDQAPADLAFSGTQFLEFKSTPVWLTDLEIGYQIQKHWHATLGANNLFNMRPRQTPASTAYANVSHYDQTASQIPLSGGFYYGRVNYAF
ncbi:TonB-dependent receptor plug domain-containing protein [Lichenicola cladoniae]|uniref:TonB-dependent receptor plug domain-containing protein n=1 Tax=Lichenicola cladoniae TaxID=1484109 RepID=UPI001953528F|nr:TonB-dependent receptor [Lichenicola cladoniae]